jgi:hypothetical protein
VLYIFHNWKDTIEVEKDTASLFVMILPCLIFSFFASTGIWSIEFFWTFSEFLEGFAMVPQVRL